MANMNDLVSGWLKSGGTAGSVEQAEQAAKGDAMSPSSEDDETYLTSSESKEVDLMGQLGAANPEDTLEDPSKEATSEQAKPEDTKISNKEVITITDDKGKRKIEIDYSDKESIKRAYAMMHGARKWQAERDQARQEATSIKSDRDNLKRSFDALQEAYDNQGIEGIIDLIEGRTGAHKEYLNKQIERYEFLKKASPEEKAMLQAQEEKSLRDRELAKLRKELEDTKEYVTREKDEADYKALQSTVNPTFEKYRFADKLGSADDEQIFDEMLWNTALKRLEPYEEKGLPITKELVDKEFRNVAMALRKRIGAQAEKKVSKVLETKKQEATENVQAKLMSGYRSNGLEKEAADKIKSGDLTGLLKNWNKYGNLFNRK